MKAKLIEIGEKFGRFTVIGQAFELDRKHKKYLCRCECGSERAVNGNDLKTGKSKSCGCYNIECIKKRNALTKTIHGFSKKGAVRKEYYAWVAAKKRCYSPGCMNYKNYGAKGVGMCRKWRDSFSEFFNDMGPCPAGHSLDRIDPAGNYEPGNCRWADDLTQQNNRRKHFYVSFDGLTLTLSQWAAKTGISRPTLETRIKKLKWPPEIALTQKPSRK